MKVPSRARASAIDAAIFDLDGVIVSTDRSHYLAWKRLADEEGIYFDEKINERLRGVSRMECLEIVLERYDRALPDEEKMCWADRKNGYYLDALDRGLSPDDILPGVHGLLAGLAQIGKKTAIGSSSRNARVILERIQMLDAFDVIVDGNDISNGKPHPEVFLLAAHRLGVSPARCLVVEDAEAGVSAALAAGMQVLAVGCAAADRRATYRAEDLSHIRRLKGLFTRQRNVK